MKEKNPKTGENRFLEKLAYSFSQQYANPGRVGCVGKGILWKLASRPKAFRRDLGAEAVLDHISQCSPCMDQLHKMRGKAVVFRWARIAAWACTVALLLFAIVEFFRS